MDNKRDAKEILDKFNNDQASSDEKTLLERWYIQYQASDNLPPINDLLTDQKNSKKELMNIVRGRRKIKLWPYISSAAALLCLVGVSLWLYKTNDISENSAPPVVTSKSRKFRSDVAPGGNHAILTLDNGKSIVLNQSKEGVVVDSKGFTYNDGSDVNANYVKNKTLLVTLTTPKGGIYQLTLPDGSKAWVNADSKIRFPQSFAGLAKREIEITGQVYFEVYKKQDQPFVVKSKNMVVTVLGTHFDISAYENDSHTTATLVEGSLRVAHPLAAKDSKSVTLKPNQQALMQARSPIEVNDVDAREMTVWKTGKFSFDSEDLPSIMKKVERWYNVEAVFKQDMADVIVSGSVSKFVNLSTLLEKLEQTGDIQFEIDNKTVYVSKSK